MTNKDWMFLALSVGLFVAAFFSVCLGHPVMGTAFFIVGFLTMGEKL